MACGVQHNYAKSSKRERPTCAHCGVIGHLKEKCFKLHMYPPSFVQKKHKLQGFILCQSCRWNREHQIWELRVILLYLYNNMKWCSNSYKHKWLKFPLQKLINPPIPTYVWSFPPLNLLIITPRYLILVPFHTFSLSCLYSFHTIL